MRIVDAEQVKTFINNHLPIGIHEDGYTAYQDVVQMLSDEKAIPTIEAEPVRHGQWIAVDITDCCYRCSECGFIRDAYLLDIGNYCPQCGAKMEDFEWHPFNFIVSEEKENETD